MNQFNDYITNLVLLSTCPGKELPHRKYTIWWIKKNPRTGDINTRKGHIGQQVLSMVDALELETHGSKNGIYIAMKTGVS